MTAAAARRGAAPAALLLLLAAGCESPGPPSFPATVRRVQADRMRAPPQGGGAEVAAAQPAAGAIHFYQHHVAALWGSHCRYAPSCSRFGALAVAEDGWLAALPRIAGRLISCNDQAADYRPAVQLGKAVLRIDWPPALAGRFASSGETEQVRWLERVSAQPR